MEVQRVLSDFLKGRHTTGQMVNSFRYFYGKKNQVVTWDPIYISFFPTFGCNLSCDMCLTHSTKFDNPYGQETCADLSFETFKVAVDKYKNSLAINLIGNGEPLFNKDLFKMINYASKERKMYTFSGSNGIILGDYINRIVDSPLNGFTISLNGHCPAEFNRMTGMPEKWFDVICCNIVELVKQRDLKRSKLEIAVSIILDKRNFMYLKDMIYYVESLGADRVLFFQYLPTSANGFTVEERSLFSEDADVQKIFTDVRFLHPKPNIHIELPVLLKKLENNKFCSVPFYNMSIDGEGNIGCCCCQLLNLSNNGKFYENGAWNNMHFREMRQRFIHPEFPLLEPCTWCYNNSGQSRLTFKPKPTANIIGKYFNKRVNR